MWEPAGGASPLNWFPDLLPIPCTFTLQAWAPPAGCCLSCLLLSSKPMVNEVCLLLSGNFIFLKTTPTFTLPHLLSHMLQLSPPQTNPRSVLHGRRVPELAWFPQQPPPRPLSPVYPMITVLAFLATGSPQTLLPCLGALPALVRDWYVLMSSPEYLSLTVWEESVCWPHTCHTGF